MSCTEAEPTLGRATGRGPVGVAGVETGDETVDRSEVALISFRVSKGQVTCIPFYTVTIATNLSLTVLCFLRVFLFFVGSSGGTSLLGVTTSCLTGRDEGVG